MLNNITTDIEALKLEDIAINTGGAALEQAVGTNIVNIASLRDDLNQVILDRVVYAFQATSNLNANQLMADGVTALFNSIEICTPAGDFNISTFRYIVPIDGVYTFGFKCFINTVATNFRMGIYQNNNAKVMGGAGNEATEGMDCILKCIAGDTIHVGCITGSVRILWDLSIVGFMVIE